MSTDIAGREDGADNRSRTYDLRITNALLYQLSYIGFEGVDLRGRSACVEQLMQKPAMSQ